jgi:hypothetical protein
MRPKTGPALSADPGPRAGGRRRQFSAKHQRHRFTSAEQLRDVFAELGDVSARKTAEVLNARGIPTPEGGKHASDPSAKETSR